MLLLILSYCVVLPHAGAVPITIRFFQSGFTGRGHISGTLVGEDLNGDHIIDAEEFAPFYTLDSVSFSGNSLLPAFSWHGFAVGPILDLATMRLQMWTEDLGPGPNGEEGDWEYYSFYPPGDPIQGEILFTTNQGVPLTTANPTVATVPDPGSSAFMLALALGALTGIRRRLFSASRACVP